MSLLSSIFTFDGSTTRPRQKVSCILCMPWDVFDHDQRDFWLLNSHRVKIDRWELENVLTRQCLGLHLQYNNWPFLENVHGDFVLDIFRRFLEFQRTLTRILSKAFYKTQMLQKTRSKRSAAFQFSYRMKDSLYWPFFLHLKRRLFVNAASFVTWGSSWFFPKEQKIPLLRQIEQLELVNIAETWVQYKSLREIQETQQLLRYLNLG